MTRFGVDTSVAVIAVELALTGFGSGQTMQVTHNLPVCGVMSGVLCSLMCMTFDLAQTTLIAAQAAVRKSDMVMCFGGGGQMG